MRPLIPDELILIANLQRDTKEECDMMSIQEAAKFCNVCDKTIRNWIKINNPDGTPYLQGVIGTGRTTRIPKTSLVPLRKTTSTSEQEP